MAQYAEGPYREMTKAEMMSSKPTPVGYGTTQAAPPVRTCVMKELTDLWENLEHLGKILSELEERLSVVLTNPTDIAGPMKTNDADSELTGRLINLNNQAMMLIVRAEDLRRRVDL